MSWCFLSIFLSSSSLIYVVKSTRTCRISNFETAVQGRGQRAEVLGPLVWGHQTHEPRTPRTKVRPVLLLLSWVCKRYCASHTKHQYPSLYVGTNQYFGALLVVWRQHPPPIPSCISSRRFHVLHTYIHSRYVCRCVCTAVAYTRSLRKVENNIEGGGLRSCISAIQVVHLFLRPTFLSVCACTAYIYGCVRWERSAPVSCPGMTRTAACCRGGVILLPGQGE